MLMPDYDKVAAEAIAALQTKTQPQRHAIARLLKPDGPSLQVLRWIIGQPDCDVATASLVFWRLLCLPPEDPVHAAPSRAAVLELIVMRSRANAYRESGIAWNGAEAWYRTPLVSGTPLPDLSAAEIPCALFGPFPGETPEPVTLAFLDAPYEEDDAFDSLWRTSPNLTAAADWLIGKPAEVWMGAVEQLCASHPDELYRWIVLQPECPAPVAGQIFWMRDPVWYASGMLSKPVDKLEGSYAHAFDLLGPILERWRTTGFAPSQLDFSRFASPAKYRALLSEYPTRPDPLQIPTNLLDPVRGTRPEVPRICDDFNFWCIKRAFSGLAPRPRSAAVNEWQLSLEPAPPEPSRGWQWRDLFR